MKISPRQIVIAGIVLFFLANNLVWPIAFDALSDIPRLPGKVRQVLVEVLIGGLIAEACLLAVWAALGPQRLIVRLPVAYSLIIAGVCVLFLGMTIPPWGDLPLEFGIVFGVGALMLCCGIQLPLALFRLMTHYRIDGEAFDPGAAEHQPVRFGIRYLLIVTAVVALLTATVRYTFGFGQWEGGDPPWREIILMMAIMALFSSIVCLPCVWLAFGNARQRGLCLGLLLCSTLIGPLILVNVFATIQLAPPSEKWRMYQEIFMFGLGVSSTIVLTLLAIRLLGYRLVRPNMQRSSNSETRNPKQ